MHLSIEQAAVLLGKTRRQLVYMIAQGKLAANKVGGRWVIERSTLTVDAAAQQRASQRNAHFRAAVEEALAPAGKTRRYTLADLKAVQLATPIHRELVDRGADWKLAKEHMRACLDQLAIGCHRFDRREKMGAWGAMGVG